MQQLILSSGFVFAVSLFLLDVGFFTGWFDDVFWLFALMLIFAAAFFKRNLITPLGYAVLSACFTVFMPSIAFVFLLLLPAFVFYIWPRLGLIFSYYVQKRHFKKWMVRIPLIFASMTYALMLMSIFVFDSTPVFDKDIARTLIEKGDYVYVMRSQKQCISCVFYRWVSTRFGVAGRFTKSGQQAVFVQLALKPSAYLYGNYNQDGIEIPLWFKEYDMVDFYEAL